MNLLGMGLSDARHHEDALSVKEAELAMERRLGGSEDGMLIAQSNLASTYEALGRKEQAMSMRRDVYRGRLKLSGDEHLNTLIAANNYASGLVRLRRYAEARKLLRKTLPVARRVLGECDITTLRMRWIYAEGLYRNDGATLDHLHEAVNTLEEIEPSARRVFGGAHPLVQSIERHLQYARAALRARETPLPGRA